jgi:soluble lytic murein transglycosylase-like protein
MIKQRLKQVVTATKKAVIKATNFLVMAGIFACGLIYIGQQASLRIEQATATMLPPAPLTIEEVILSEADYHGINPGIIRGIIQQESAWDASAVSSAGAIGLMQVTPWTAKRVCEIHDPKLLFEPKLNIQCGVAIFALHYKDRGSVIAALREYNGGYRCMKSKRCGESENYWPRVLNYSVSVTNAPEVG